MIAIYYVDLASPYTLYDLEVKSDSYKDFITAIIKDKYPLPSADIMFVDNNKVFKNCFIEDLEGYSDAIHKKFIESGELND